MSPKIAWKPGDRATLIFVVTMTALMYSGIILGVWALYLYLEAPFPLAAGITVFLSAMAIWFFGGIWRDLRQMRVTTGDDDAS